MDPKLVAALIAQVGVPELVRWLHERHAAAGSLPTDADIVAKLQLDAATGIARGEAWLAAHPASQSPA